MQIFLERMMGWLLLARKLGMIPLGKQTVSNLKHELQPLQGMPPKKFNNGHKPPNNAEQGFLREVYVSRDFCETYPVFG